MGILHNIITGVSIAGFGALFTFLWKMNAKMVHLNDVIKSLCNYFEESKRETAKLLEHDINIKLLEKEVINLKESIDEAKKEMGNRFDELNKKVDSIRDNNP